MNKIYAGIGSRETPFETLNQMRNLAKYLSDQGWVLRSGGANGADTAFEEGCVGAKEIYLPWKGFNNRRNGIVSAPSHEAKLIALNHHPRWDRCSNAAQLMHIRNVYQVLGQNLDTPADMVVCWTKDGKASGGTGQAIRIAKTFSVPVYNLFNDEDKDAFMHLFKEPK